MLTFMGSTVLAGNNQQSSIADQPISKDSATASSTIGNVTATAPPPQSPHQGQLQGSVQEVELSLEKLQDVGLDLKEALRAASSLYDEVTIQPVRIITQPSLVGGAGTIINVPVGTEPVGPPKPARKDRVDSAINSMKPIITLLKNNVDNFVDGKKQMDLPEDVLTQLEPRFREWIDSVDSLDVKLNKLEQMTEAPPYDNKAIAVLTQSMQKDIKSLERVRATIYKVVRKQGKRVNSKK